MNEGLIGSCLRYRPRLIRGIQKIGAFAEPFGRTIPSSNLTHFWPLTANGNDSVGGVNLTAPNGVTSYSEEGVRLVSASKQYLTGSVSFSGTFSWVFEAKIVGAQLALGACDSNGAYPCRWRLMNDGSMVVSLTINSRGDGQDMTIPIPWNIVDNQFHTFAMTGDTATYKTFLYYIDGIQVGANRTRPDGTLSINSSFSIGRQGAGDDHYTDGYVRNFRMYNVVLSPIAIFKMSR